MSSEEREPRPYVSPAKPVVIGNAGAAANFPGGSGNFDGGVSFIYTSQPDN